MLYQRLSRMCFDTKFDDIFTSLDATRNYLVVESLRPMSAVDDQAEDNFQGVETTDPNAVVIRLNV